MNVLQMTRVGVISLLSVLLVGGVITATTADGQRNAEAKRRIIVNDDGEVVLPRGGKSWDDYLGARFKDAIGTQVDSYFLNIAATDRGPGIVDSLQSSMAYWAAGKRLPERYVKATRRYIAAARKAVIEGPDKTARIPRDAIEEMTRSNISIMPKDLDKTLTEQQLVDLVAYLKSLK